MKICLCIIVAMATLLATRQVCAETALPAAWPGPDELVRLDDFESGVDAGWNIAGDSHYISFFSKKLVWPGYESKLALRLTRMNKEGWAGLAIGNLQRLVLASCDGLVFQARSQAGVSQIRVDIFLADGSRWYQKFPLNASGQWTPIIARSDRFHDVDGSAKSVRPNCATITRLWITMEDFSRSTDIPECALDIDDVSLIGKRGNVAISGVGSWQSGLPAKMDWHGNQKRVLILNAEDFPPSGQIAGFDRAVARVIAQSGGTARLIAPQDLRGSLTAQACDLMILNGPAYPQDDGGLILDYLKSGGAVWLVGPQRPLSRPLMRGADGTWMDGNDAGKSRDMMRAVECLIGQSWVVRSPMDLTEPVVSITDTGRTWWPEAPSTLPAVRAGTLSLLDSIDRVTLPPWVAFEPLFQESYRKKNWIQHEDVFTAAPAAIFRISAGDYAGARVLLTAFSGEADSVLNPQHPAFARVAAVGISRLSAPVRERTELPDAPLAGLPEITRQNYLHYPGPIMMPLNFSGLPTDDQEFWLDMDRIGFNVVHTGIPWLKQAAPDGEVINWADADSIVRDARSRGRKIVFDGYSFYWRQFTWTGTQTFHNPVFRERFYDALRKLAERYQNEPAVVAVYATPLTGGFGAMVNQTPEGLAAWRAFVRDELQLSLADASRRYGLSLHTWDDLDVPVPTLDKPVNIGPMWADYIAFYTQSYGAFIRGSVQAIRQAAPDMPVLIRANYLDCAISMAAAAEYKNVAAHIECVETTVDTEAYFRGLGLRFCIPISAENGWPKIRGGALRMALADYLMGGYADFQYSFAGPHWALPGVQDLHTAQNMARKLRAARYPSSPLALLIPDTTLYASRPASFRSVEAKPHVEFLMERSGIQFESVSAQFPRLDGLKIIVDDGSNFVLTAACRDALARWVRAGGTLIGFPTTGQRTLDGSAGLYEQLGLQLPDHLSDAVMCQNLDAGRVVIVPSVPNWKNADERERFENILMQAGAYRPVEATPHVNQAFFKADGKNYLVLFDKSPDYVGSFFTESRMEKVEHSLRDGVITLKPAIRFTRARELVTGKKLRIERGTLHIDLPATQFRVVELE